MNNKVLIGYASKYGSTVEIARKIGQVLAEGGVSCDVLPVDQVTDISPYRAVIVGSAVYIGQWRKEAAAFLESHAASLSERPVWIFSCGPTGTGDPVELLKGWRLPEKLQPVVDRIKPRDVAVFNGVLDQSRLNFIERFLVKGIKAPTGDFRNWDAITAWAALIRDALIAQA